MVAFDLARKGLRPAGRRLVAAERAAGFSYVALDLEGFRSGSMNPRGGVGCRGVGCRGGVGAEVRRRRMSDTIASSA